MTNRDDEKRAIEDTQTEIATTGETLLHFQRHTESRLVGIGEIESIGSASSHGEYFAHFRIHEEVGRGAMGTVYRALDTLLDRQVAVKVLSEHLSQNLDFQERFIREAKILARMNHPNIPQIHFIGKAQGRFFFAMEWIEGETLEHLLAEGAVSEIRALNIAMQAAEALRIAHNAGIVHRDIKPSNLMLTPDAVVKVLDFGIAQSAAMQGDDPGSFVGTPQYASPEQARGAAIDARSDMYSLGLTLFHLLTGRRPFAGDTAQAVLKDRKVRPSPVLTEEAVPDVGIRAVVARMLRTEPDDRFPDCGVLLDAMRAVYPVPPVPAPLTKRAMAYLTDLLLVGIPLVALFAAFWAVKGYFITTPLYSSVPGRIILGVGVFAWFACYAVLLGGKRGRTLGQRLQGTRVMRRDGEEASSWAMAVRTAILWGPVCLAIGVQLDWPPVLVLTPTGSIRELSNLSWVAALLWIFLGSVPMLNRRRLSLTDWLSRTQVVQTPRPPTPRGQESAAEQGWFRGLRNWAGSPKPLVDAGVLIVWLFVVIVVGIEFRSCLPPNRWKVYSRHTMFERVEPGDPAWDRLAERFLGGFLGKNKLARNPSVLTFERHPFLPLLFALPDSDLVVENRSLGTRAHHFGRALSNFAGYLSGGSRHGEEMEPVSDVQARLWEMNRRQAYGGSFPHFLRALTHRRLAREGFEVLNPKAFVGLFRAGEEFYLIAWPTLQVHVPGQSEPQVLRLPQGWLRVSPDGANKSGAWGGSWRGGGLPRSVLSAYAAEQDSAWGVVTESIQRVLVLE